MKKYYIISALFAGALLFSACNDLLDLRTNGTINMQEVFSDRNRTRGYLNSCYSFIEDMPLDVASYSDDAQSSYDNTNGSAANYWYTQGLTPTNFGSYNFDGDPWSSCFQAIRKCNVFLANIDGATEKITDKERAGWKAQAQTLRAFFYLQLMKRYGQVPLFTEELATDHAYSSDSKASIGEITNQILADCDAAIATPGSEEFDYTWLTNQWGMMTKAVAQAVRAEAVTWAVSPLLSDGTFTKEQALEVAADALSNLLKNDYKLWTDATATNNAYPEEAKGAAAYAAYFLYNPNDLRAKDKETIYGGSRVAVWSESGLPVVAGITTAGNCPTQDLVDAYNMSNGQMAITGYSDANHLQPVINSASGYNDAKPYVGRDPRFYVSVFYNGSKRGNAAVAVQEGGTCEIRNNSIQYTHTGYYMRKYASDASNRNSNSDGYVRLIRLPEVYFNFAEIAYQTVGPDAKVSTSGLNLSAKEAVDFVRERSGMPSLPSGLSAADFEVRYRNERRVEFALEADRMFCLRRWKEAPSHKFVTGVSITGTGSNVSYDRFRFEDRASSAEKYLFYPINLTESNKIIELTGGSWQNPGWE